MSDPTLRWGHTAPGDPADARSRLLDAAAESFARLGVAKTTVEDVARTAKVSRATVYRYFDGGRDELVLGVILRDADRYFERVRPRLERQASLGAAVVEFVDLGLRGVARDPALRRMFDIGEPGSTGHQVAGRSVALFEKVTALFRPLFEHWADQVRPGLDPADASEWILRALLSLLSLDGPRRRSPDGARTYLETYLVPAIVRP